LSQPGEACPRESDEQTVRFKATRPEQGSTAGQTRAGDRLQRARRGKEDFLGHFRRRGHVSLRDISALLSDAGLKVVESGAVGFRDLQFALATSP
jgi:hypothetical protein